MIYRATIIPRGGEPPYIDPVTACARVTPGEIYKRADNPEAIKRPGVNSLVISVYPYHWHISAVSGWTYETGLYTILTEEAHAND